MGLSDAVRSEIQFLCIWRLINATDFARKCGSIVCCILDPRFSRRFVSCWLTTKCTTRPVDSLVFEYWKVYRGHDRSLGIDSKLPKTLCRTSHHETALQPTLLERLSIHHCREQSILPAAVQACRPPLPLHTYRNGPFQPNRFRHQGLCQRRDKSRMEVERSVEKSVSQTCIQTETLDADHEAVRHGGTPDPSQDGIDSRERSLDLALASELSLSTGHSNLLY